MGISGFDHAVIPTSQPEEMIAFYKRLGFEVVGEEEWRQGRARIFAFAFGDAKINVHPPDVWSTGGFSLRGPTAVPGCGDFCFVWDGSVDSAKEMLEGAGAGVIEGPVSRVGGRALGRQPGPACIPETRTRTFWSSSSTSSSTWGRQVQRAASRRRGRKSTDAWFDRLIYEGLPPVKPRASRLL
jgi:catechol 2,3-dioxygenase-like lactoylglutathione lyase family enzyme